MNIRAIGKKFIRSSMLMFAVFTLMIGQVQIARADTFSTISGHFSDGSGNPVANMELLFTSASGQSNLTTTDENGYYSVDVVPDLYDINMNVNWYNGNTKTIIQSDINGTTRVIDATNGNVTQNLKFDTVALSVSFVDQNNQPIHNADITANQLATGSVPQTNTTLLEGHPEVGYYGYFETTPPAKSNIDGVATITVLRGMTYDVCAVDPISGLRVCKQFIPTNSTNSVAITSPEYNTISGHFTDNSGNPVKNMELLFTSASGQSNATTTDENGHYSVNIVPDVYDVNMNNNWYNGNTKSIIQFDINGVTRVIDATNGNVTQNLKFDTVPLTVNFIDQNNQPIQNANVTANQLGTGSVPQTNTTLLEGHPEVGYYGYFETTPPAVSDVNGAATITVLRGMTYNVCAVDPIDNAEHCLVYSPDGDINTIMINKVAAGLMAPTGLSVAQNPTKAPSLSWNVVTGATSYNIYANDTIVGTSTTNSYVDNNPTSGANTYYITAVNESGESSQSNTVTVTVDITIPVVTNVNQVWNTVKQRTEVTLTFSEPVSGLPQGWYGSGTTYTKAFYNTKLATVTFYDAVGNMGSTTVKPVGSQ